MARATREQWAERVRLWTQSGLTGRAFAERHSLRERSLLWWKWKLAAEKGPSKRRKPKTAALTVQPVSFVEVTAAVRGEPIEIVLASGRCVRVPDGFVTATLSRVLDVLEARR